MLLKDHKHLYCVSVTWRTLYSCRLQMTRWIKEGENGRGTPGCEWTSERGHFIRNRRSANWVFRGSERGSGLELQTNVKNKAESLSRIQGEAKRLNEVN